MGKFVNNLDFLVGFDDDTLYKQTTPENIHAMIENFQVVDSEGQKFTICSPIQKFKIFGPGVYLMFKFLKYLMLMFGVISLIALFQLILLLKSPFYQGYQDIVRINLLRFTIPSIQSQHYNIYIGLDVLIVITVLIFMVFWSQNLRSYANHCNQAHPLPSYQTVQLKKVNNNLRQQTLTEYLRQLKIQPFQIYIARNYGVFLKHYAELTEIATQFRILRQIYINEDSFLQKHRQSRRILQKFIQLNQKYCSIKIQEFNYTKYKPLEVFIVLKSYHEREKLLKINNKKLFNSCFENKQSSQFEFKACQVEPQAIAWQNIGISFVSYAVRAIILFLMLCIITLMGTLIIFVLQVLQTASIGDAYYYHEEALKDLKNHSLLFQIKSHKSTQQVQPQANYTKLATLIILTPIVIFTCKKLIMGLLSHFVYFRKYPSQVSRIKSQTKTLTIFYFFVAGVLHLILYLKTDIQKLHTISIYQLLYPIILKMFQITNFNPASIHLYSDFSLEWYKQATFFIIIIGSTSFNFSNCYKFIVNTIAFHYHKRKASKQKTLYGVKKLMHGIDLHIEHVNASMIVITFFVLLYGCSIPLIVLFGLINLVVLFYITKITFIKYGKKPLRLGLSISRTIVNLILIGILIHCLMTPIFLGAEGIGMKNMHQKVPNQISQKQINDLDSHFRPKVQTVTQRFQKFGPIYLTIAAFTLLYLIFRKIFHKKIIQKIKQKLYKTDKDQDICKQIEHPAQYPSYSMHNNPNYSQIIKNIYLMNSVQAQRLSCPIPQQFQNLKSLHEITDYRSKIMSQILQINRQYLNRQKYPTIYGKIEQLAVIKQYYKIQLQSQLIPDKKTNDRFKINCQAQQQF